MDVLNTYGAIIGILALVVGAGVYLYGTAQITRLDAVNAGTGDFAIGSELVVLGHN